MTKEEKREIYTKKLLYQSMHRGSKENDIILGGFAKESLAELSDDELVEFENILALSDNEIYDWYTKKKPVPAKHHNPVLLKILDFKPVK